VGVSVCALRKGTVGSVLLTFLSSNRLCVYCVFEHMKAGVSVCALWEGTVDKGVHPFLYCIIYCIVFILYIIFILYCVVT
jgi:hypothetical protein